MMKVVCVSLFALLSRSCFAFAPNNPNTPAQFALKSSNEDVQTHAQHSEPPRFEGDVDETALLAQSDFPIKPNDLIDLAKEAFFVKGLGLKDEGKCLADDFVFRAAFVETSRDDFFKALNNFKLEDSFAVKQQFFGWTVDPFQPNRVWVMNRQEAKHVADFMGVKPTGKTLVLPPQSYHMDFTKDGKIQEFGFYVVDRAQGNTGGLGGVFGYFYGVGRPLPFPEGKPYKKSFRRRLLEFVSSRILPKLPAKKKQNS